MSFYSFTHPETGELWMSGSDIAKSLGYVDFKAALCKIITNEDKRQWSKLIKGVVGLAMPTETPSNWQPTTMMINEAGLNHLIMSSKLKNAQKYKDWVCREVLPSIRKIGRYELVSTTKSNDDIAGQNSVIENYKLMLELQQTKMDMMQYKYEKEMEIVKLNTDNEISKLTTENEMQSIKNEKTLLEAHKRELEAEKRALESEKSTAMILTNRIMRDVAANILLNDKSKTELGFLRKEIEQSQHRLCADLKQTNPTKVNYLALYIENAQEYSEFNLPKIIVCRTQKQTIDRYDELIKQEEHIRNGGESTSKRRKLNTSDDWLKTVECFYKIEYPNSISLWTFIQNTQKYVFYGMKKLKSFRELKFLDKKELSIKFHKDLNRLQTINPKYADSMSAFKLLNIDSVEVLYEKCFTPLNKQKEVMIQMVNMAIETIQTVIDQNRKVIEDERELPQMEITATTKIYLENIFKFTPIDNKLKAIEQ